MAGIYIHIPFCKTHCSYCDFYSITDDKNTSEIIDTICLELDLRKNYLEREKIETIYFGGGTPSFIETEFLEKIVSKIGALFTVSENAEITLEINPDDVTTEKVDKLSKIGFNRASLGIQSFNDNLLTFLKRRHNASQAKEAIRILKDSGFSNISIDLIYGIPGMAQKGWLETLEQVINLEIQHISAYHLTIEKGTELHKNFSKGKIIPVKDFESEKYYKVLCKFLKNNGCEHYEISNFSKPGFKSKHNNSYWEGKKYLGVGPSAHSFNGKSRQWNVSDTKKYIDEIKKQGRYFTSEKLSKKDRYNEYVLTRLRTDIGINKNEIKELFGKTYLEYFLIQSEKFLNNKQMIENADKNLIIPEKIWFVSDGIISDLCKI